MLLHINCDLLPQSYHWIGSRRCINSSIRLPRPLMLKIGVSTRMVCGVAAQLARKTSDGQFPKEYEVYLIGLLSFPGSHKDASTRRGSITNACHRAEMQ